MKHHVVICVISEFQTSLAICWWSTYNFEKLSEHSLKKQKTKKFWYDRTVFQLSIANSFSLRALQSSSVHRENKEDYFYESSCFVSNANQVSSEKNKEFKNLWKQFKVFAKIFTKNLFLKESKQY